MLKRLKIHRFRHVEPGTELVFAERFNVLLGKNGTGKTTLLDLISMVLRSDFSALREEEFDIEYEFFNQDGEERVRFQNRRRQTSLEAAESQLAAAMPRGRPKVHEYEPHVSIMVLLKQTQSEIEVDGPRMRWRDIGRAWEGDILIDVFEPWFWVTIAASLRPSTEPGAYFALTDLVSSGAESYRFDESLQVFESITADVDSPNAITGRVPSIAIEACFIEQSTKTGYVIFWPHFYLPTLPQVGQSSAKVEFIWRDSAIQKFPKLSGFEDMSMSLAVKGSTQQFNGLWWQFGHAEFLFSRAGGSINHHALSYGQKRLLAFLYYLDVNKEYVIADELVNGMHHDWIRACLDEIGDRQSFLTSQNPLLLDYLPLESAEQVQRTFIRCTAKTSGDDVTFVWSNLSDDEARELFADYEVGIQHVGELLRVRGLW